MLTILEQLTAYHSKRSGTTQQAAREQRRLFLVRILKAHAAGCTVKQLMVLLSVSQATVCDMLNELADEELAEFELKEVDYGKAPIRVWKLSKEFASVDA